MSYLSADVCRSACGRLLSLFRDMYLQVTDLIHIQATISYICERPCSALVFLMCNVCDYNIGISFLHYCTLISQRDSAIQYSKNVYAIGGENLKQI